jgi:hypothetical protein
MAFVQKKSKIFKLKPNHLTPKRAHQIKEIQESAQQQDPAKLPEILWCLVDN